MAISTKITLGTIALIIFSTLIYVQFQESVKLKITSDYTEIYVNLNNSWQLAGKEAYPKLYNGTRLVYRDGSPIISYSYSNKTLESIVTRKTFYKTGTEVLETYFFNGYVTAPDLVP